MIFTLLIMATAIWCLVCRRRRLQPTLATDATIVETDKSSYAITSWPPSSDAPTAILSTFVPAADPVRPAMADLSGPLHGSHRRRYSAAAASLSFASDDGDSEPYFGVRPVSSAASVSAVSQPRTWDMSARLSDALWDRRGGERSLG